MAEDEVGGIMDTDVLIRKLREVAEVLKPHIDMPDIGTPPRNGDASASEDPPAERAWPWDHGALAWWCTVSTMADLLDLQRSDPSPEQLRYIQKAMLGGAPDTSGGSFQDYSLEFRDYDLDQKSFKGTEDGANASLRRLTTELSEIVENLLGESGA